MRRRVAIVVGAIAVLCALAAQHAFATAIPAPLATLLGARGPGLTDDSIGAKTMPLALVLASLLAIAGAAVALPRPMGRQTIRRIAREDVRRLGLCAALLALPTLAAVALWSLEDFQANEIFTRSSSTLAALLWLAGLAGALVTVRPSPGAARRRLLATWRRHPSRAPWAEAIALTAIVAVAVALRVWHLATLPEGIWFDEVDSSKSAVALLHLPFQPFAPGNVGHTPSLYFYVMAILVQLGGDTIGMVRLASAVFGVLAVVAVYLLGRQAGGPALGLAAAALMAMAQWAVDFSRIGMLNIAAPATLSLGFVTLAVAMRRPRAFWFALCGVALGLALLTYEGGYLSALVAVAVIGLRLALDGRFRRAAWRNVGLMPIGLLAGAAPLLLMILKDPAYTLDRITTVSLSHEYPQWSQFAPALMENLRRHLLMMTWIGDNNGRHNLPGAPMLDPIMGACLLLGLGICLRYSRYWFYQLLLLWFVISMLGGVLSLDFEAPQGARTIGAIAPIALIAALPLALLGRTIWRASLRVRAVSVVPRSIAALAASVVVAVPLGVCYAHNTGQYFVQQATDMSSWAAMSGPATITGRMAAMLSRQGYTVRVDPGVVGDWSMVYAAGGLSPDAYDSGVPVPLPLPRGGLALIIPIDKTEVFDTVHGAYPQARVIPLTPDFAGGAVQANVVIITPADVARNVGVSVVFGHGGGAIAQAHLQGAIPWPNGRSAPTTATIHATLLISSAEAWQPLSYRVIGARSAVVSIDGETWYLSRGGTPPLQLGAGNHALTVTASGRVGPAIALQWTAPSGMGAGRLWSLLPAVALQAPTLPTGGLLGLYNPGPFLTATPTLARVDQSVNAYYQNAPPTTQFPFSARWMGRLSIARSGIYAFSLESVGPSSLFIDGVRVTASGPNLGQRIGTIALRQGQHSIRVEYNATGSYLHCYLTWAPPGQPFTPIPPSATLPYVGR